ncbi:Aste57867_23012 [Aphanomyces stellatus]|uniref:Aste57867_23012 protein n=1 Tax=Aphanomyces stellatus TaxID=120398 RepID=A0A485LR86_9STRA|nr:hypothetical protein As57867_022941 [Aphanomyces stellatus]VFT99660.1 Aste57867_23012 [Aphanomyces stellatus]
MQPPFLWLLWAMLALVCVQSGAHVHVDVEDDLFIEDYFYGTPDDDLKASALSDVNPSISSLPADAIALTDDDAELYTDFVLGSSQTQDILVFLSTSASARAEFERGARRLVDEGLVDSSVRFFALPLHPQDGDPPASEFDMPNNAFMALHGIPSVPASGLHIIVQFAASAPSRTLAITPDNAKMVPLTTTENDWMTKLQAALTSMRAPRADLQVPSSMPSLLTIGIGGYALLVALPKFVSNWATVVSYVQSKRFWFYVCLAIMYLSLSGTFYTIIHGAPLFYFSSQGFALLHPQSQRQFALEGLFGGMFPFAVSGALLSMSHGMPYMLNPENRVHCIFMAGMVLTISLFLEHSLFSAKNRWYRLF